ncbi:unnamed protein product [Caenorhabditis angaria]|uniref:Uncharacterized protein n=1 Tax=Caenorhabditis angaria TaxID=860376 RepID=A0A9P1IYQ0_9PELO|nr:unnamed protein product [Caenorhabditis angaria]
MKILAPKSEFNWNYSESQVSEDFAILFGQKMKSNNRKSDFEPAKLNDLSVVRFLRFQFWWNQSRERNCEVVKHLHSMMYKLEIKQPVIISCNLPSCFFFFITNKFLFSFYTRITATTQNILVPLFNRKNAVLCFMFSTYGFATSRTHFSALDKCSTRGHNSIDIEPENGFEHVEIRWIWCKSADSEASIGSNLAKSWPVEEFLEFEEDKFDFGG